MVPREEMECLKDDDLPTLPVSSWAEDKYRLVSIFGRIFSTGMKRRWACRTYIDLFAGPGIAKIRDTNRILPASPLLALGVPDQYDKYIFCEKEEENLKALKTRVRRSYPDADVTYIHGDCDEKVDEICSSIPRGRGILSFCFMDPYNIGIRLETVRKLSQFRMDFIILLAIGMDAVRNIRHHGRIGKCLGDDDWKEEWAQAERGGKRFQAFFAEKYISQMERLGYMSTARETMHEMRSNDRNLPLYHLAFFSKNPLGYRFWKEALKYGSDQAHLPFET